MFDDDEDWSTPPPRKPDEAYIEAGLAQVGDIFYKWDGSRDLRSDTRIIDLKPLEDGWTRITTEDWGGIREEDEWCNTDVLIVRKRPGTIDGHEICNTAMPTF